MQNSVQVAAKAERVLELAWNRRLPVAPNRLSSQLVVTRGREKRAIALENVENAPFSGHATYDAECQTYICRFNGQEDDARQRFVQAHLLGHVVLGHVHHPGLEPDTQFPVEPPSAVEREANVFAAALLMPEDMLRVAVRRHPCIDTLARLFGVSTNAIHQRLVGLGMLG